MIFGLLDTLFVMEFGFIDLFMLGCDSIMFGLGSRINSINQKTRVLDA